VFSKIHISTNKPDVAEYVCNPIYMEGIRRRLAAQAGPRQELKALSEKQL
jgi:hypothetical protein